MHVQLDLGKILQTHSASCGYGGLKAINFVWLKCA
jgi:hypothetical protein